jgi:hypothetical protein
MRTAASALIVIGSRIGGARKRITPMTKLRAFSERAAAVLVFTFVLMASTGAVAAGWSKADLTAITGAPAAAGVPMGYTTNLNGQGPVARVVYETTSGHVEELSVA